MVLWCDLEVKDWEGSSGYCKALGTVQWCVSAEKLGLEVWHQRAQHNLQERGAVMLGML